MPRISRHDSFLSTSSPRPAGFIATLAQARRMTRRDWRAGELRFLLIALIVAVSALSSVGFFVDRMRNGMNRDANQLLGADLVVRVDAPVQQSWMDEARRRGLAVARTVSFPSMASSGEGDTALAQLASIKAVTPGYPLRGSLKLVPDTRAAAGTASASATAAQAVTGVPTRATPAPGTVWIDPSLMAAQNLQRGGQLRLGERSFTIAQVIASEPDRGASFMNFAPRVMLAESDLTGTGLIQLGSRATWRLLVAGDPQAMRLYQRWIEQDIEQSGQKGVHIESLESGRPEMRATLDRAEQFLSLVGLLSAMLAAVAIAMAARRFMVRHMDACAMLRCLGMRQNQVLLMYLAEFVFIGLAGSLIGVALGFAAHFVLLEWLGKLVAHDLPPASWLPALQGLCTGLILLVGFALPPVLQLRNVPHNRVIRREQETPQAMTVATYGLGLACFVGLLLWQAGNVKLGLLTAGGFLGGLALFSLVAWLGLKSLRSLRNVSAHPAWRFAVTALQRRPGATVVQVVALSLGLMALLLLTVIRSDLASAWRASTPADAPNHFVINIQAEQTEAVRQRLLAAGAPAPVLYPMIRGRLVRINEAAITGSSYEDDRARRLVEREFNLSALAKLPSSNQITAGRWFAEGASSTGGASSVSTSASAPSAASLPSAAPSPSAASSPSSPSASAGSGPASTMAEASVEEGLAKTLKLKLGDRLVFDIAGQQVEAKITSLRKLEWGSMQVNFFVILDPRSMTDMPKSWITAVRLPTGQPQAISRLIREFPNLTVVDIGSLVQQLQDVVDQVIAAVEFLFLFTLLSGVLVLYAALAGSQDQRLREAAILRALGATRQQLSLAQRIEFALVGTLAGFLAASGAAATGWALARHVFSFEWQFSPLVWLAGIAVGAACALFGGWAGLRNVLRQPPLTTLREA